MRLRHQFAVHSFRAPESHGNSRISSLIDEGLITDLNEHGFPLTTALGNLILKNVENIFSANAALADIDMVRLPTAMETATLERGQKLGDQFRSKIMHLTGSLADHHVISTPETLFVQLGLTDTITHAHLPIRYSYLDNLHRQKTNGRGALFPQQIKIFGGITVSKKELIDQEIELIHGVATKSFEAMGLPYHQEDQHGGFDHEYFYIAQPANEGENLILPHADANNRVKAYSLGMVYNYKMLDSYRLRYRTPENNNKAPGMVSYGFCTPRILHCVLHHYHDDKGFNLPSSIRPFDVAIIPADEDSIGRAEDLYKTLRSAYMASSGGNIDALNRICLDDRIKVSVTERRKFSDFIGVPLSVILSKDNFRLDKRDAQTQNLTGTIQDIANSIMELAI